MGRFFSPDSGFIRFMTKVFDIMMLSFFVIVLSAGVITIGPALTALYYVALKEVRDEEGNILKSYFKSFKQNFIQSALMEIILVVIGFLLAFEIDVMYDWMMHDNAALSKIVFGALCGVVAVIGSGFLYVFPMIAKFYNTTFRILKNSVAMAVGNLPYTILIAIITAVMAFIIYINPYFAIIVIGAWAFLTSMCYNKVFDKYIPKAKEEEKPDTISTEDRGYTASAKAYLENEEENNSETAESTENSEE